MFNPKKMLILMMLFAAGTFVLFTQFLDFPHLYALPQSYIAMGIPCGTRILNKLRFDSSFSISIPIGFLLILVPFIFVLAVIIGIVTTPYYFIRCIYNIAKGC